MNIKEAVRYDVYDNVDMESHHFYSFSDLQSYADIWRDRLNEENEQMGEHARYSTETINDIENVFEVCNIDINKVHI